MQSEDLPLELVLWPAFPSDSGFQKMDTQLCPTLCDPMDCSLPGSSIRGIFQARILEWVAISFSRKEDLPDPRIKSRFLALQADALPSKPLGKSMVTWELVKNADSQGMYQKCWI